VDESGAGVVDDGGDFVGEGGEERHARKIGEGSSGGGGGGGED
jgi:hypothetical protein